MRACILPPTAKQHHQRQDVARLEDCGQRLQSLRDLRIQLEVGVTSSATEFGPGSQNLVEVNSERQTMGKHARKRQRKDRPAESVAPLGTAALLDDDADKDDDERRLESLLFGKPLISARGTKVTAVDENLAEENDGADVTAAELEGMLDSDVSNPLALPS